MVEAGVFGDEKLELIHGVIVEMSPQGQSHSIVIRKLTNILVPLLAGRALLQVQLPFAASDDSEPEPDLSIVPPGEYSDDHPRETWLIIEVAVTSLAKDCGVKADLYAASNQPEFWLIDVENRRVIVHRQPTNGRYADIQSFNDGQTLALLQFADVKIPVVDVFPKVRG